jgi:hypothetical protein
MIPSVLAQHVEQGVNSRVQGAGFRGPQTCPLPPAPFHLTFTSR